MGGRVSIEKGCQRFTNNGSSAADQQKEVEYMNVCSPTIGMRIAFSCERAAD